MSKLITAPVARNLLVLRADEFRPFREYLENVATSATVEMAQTNDVERWRKLQGRWQLADELLREIEASDATLMKLSSR